MADTNNEATSPAPAALIIHGIPVGVPVPVDAELDPTSDNPVSNAAVCEKFDAINTHLSNKAAKVWTEAGAIGAMNTPVTVPTTGVSEIMVAGAFNINGSAEIADTVVIPMQFLSQDRNFRLQYGFGSEIGEMQISYLKNNSAFYITNEYYYGGTITARAMVVYYR